MFKNIFSSRKKSKSELATPSTKDANNHAQLGLSKSSQKTVLPVASSQLNNEVSHFERAVDVPGEKQMNCHVPVSYVSSSIDCLPTCTVVSSEMKSSVSDLHMKRQVEAVQRKDNKDYLNSVQSDMRITASHGLLTKSIDALDGDPCVLYQQQQCQTESKVTSLRSQVNVLTKGYVMPDVLLINDFDHSRSSLNSKFTVQCSNVGNERHSQRSDHLGRTDVQCDTVLTSKYPKPMVHPASETEDTENSSFSDDIIPELVPFNIIGMNFNSEVCKFSNVSMEASNLYSDGDIVRVANESEMIILTDSFLDYSSASCVNATVRSCMPHGLDSDVIVADDYTPQPVTVCRQERQRSLDEVNYDPCTSSKSMSWTSSVQSCIPIPSDGKSTLHERQQELSTTKQKQWQKKPVRDWSSNDVLLWVEDVGLGDYYEAFKRNAVVGRDLSVVSIKLLDRLNICGQHERELVLNRLYLLHAPGLNGNQVAYGGAVIDTGSSASHVSVTDCEMVATMTDCSHSVQSRQMEEHYCPSVVKQLDFDEMSLGTSHYGHHLSHGVESNGSCSSATVVSHSSVATCTDGLVEQSHCATKNQTSQPSIMIHSNVELEAIDEVRCLHGILSTMSSGAVGSVIALNLNIKEAGSLGFMLGLDNSERPIVKHVEKDLPLKKGDRILEVNGVLVLPLAELQLYKHLRRLVGDIKIVVLRLPDSSQLKCLEDIESVKEDLVLALMELEAVQHENKDLMNELNRFKKNDDIEFESDDDAD